MKLPNPLLRELPCPACGQSVRVNLLAVWGHERLRCAGCDASIVVHFVVPSFIVTFAVLTAIYGLGWLTPWESGLVGAVFIMSLLPLSVFALVWTLGYFVALDKSPPDD